MAGMLDLSIGSNRPNGATRDLAIDDCYAAVAVLYGNESRATKLPLNAVVVAMASFALAGPMCAPPVMPLVGLPTKR